MSEMLERVAQALYAKCKYGWPMGDVRIECQELARAAQQAIEDAGYVIVPREPTEAMVAKGCYEQPRPEWHRPPRSMGEAMIASWQAMIDAALEDK